MARLPQFCALLVIGVMALCASPCLAYAVEFSRSIQVPVPVWDTNQPCDAAMDASGTLWTIDRNRERIVGFAADGREVASWGGEGNLPGLFEMPEGIAVAPDQTVWVSDTSPARLQHFDPQGGLLGTIALAPGGAYAQGMAVDASGSVYVVEQSPGVVRKFSPDGQLQLTIGYTDGYHHYQEPDSFGEPIDVSLDATGNIYVVDEDWNDSRVVVFGPDGTFLRRISVAESPDIGGCAVAPNGDVIVAASGRLLRYSSAGSYSGAIASLTPAGGPPYMTPGDVSITPTGSIVWCDEGVMRFFSADGTPGQVVGTRVNPIPPSFGTPVGLGFNAQGVGFAFDGSMVHKFADTGDYLGEFPVPSADGFTMDASATMWTVGYDDLLIHHFGQDGASLQGSFEATGSGPGIGVAADGSVYVYDKWNHSIAHYDASGAEICRWRCDDVNVVNWILRDHLLVAPNGDVLLEQTGTDQGDEEMHRYSAEGSLTATFSLAMSPPSYVRIEDMVISPSGQIFTCDSYNRDIRWFAADGTPGGTYYGPADRPFQSPHAISFDPQGRLWVADGSNLRAFDVSGLVQPACEASPAAPAVDQTVTVSSALPGQQGGLPEDIPVAVQCSSNGATWTTVANVTALGSQPVRWSTRAASGQQQFRMVFQGASRGRLTAYSTVAGITGIAAIKPTGPKFSIGKPSTPTLASLGRRFTVAGTAGPRAAAAGLDVRIEAYRYERLKSGRHGWVLRARKSVRVSKGRYSARLVLRRRGKWRVRALLMRPSPLTSLWRYLRVA